MSARGVITACALLACGGTPTAAPLAPSTADAGASDAGDTDADPVGGVMSIEVLAARGASDAPLMRELARVERLVGRSTDVKAERDLCVRAIYAASSGVRVSVVDGTGARRGDVATGASGTVPPRGPACVKKGETVHLVVDGDAALVRAIVFGAP